ncbi:MAG TPA: PIN domain-containing protein, partial [Nonomuraea sp.]|nr:PIN domain-containing protein [Nonomuraea sp.]
DDGEPTKQAQARRLLKPENQRDLVISAQVRGVFYVTVRRKLAVVLPEREAVLLIESMRQLPIVPIDSSLVSVAIAASREWQISYWDALIVAAAQASGCEVLLSEDLSDGAVYSSVRVENPFKNSGS